ncbi:protein NPG1-like [Prosopis cineraria]|uniref:protein NPG1-like n=1 Tax=Prosopis cineraria TaxID=364024 RepID=UPI00240F8C5A|nr:protein NPG1-like [Prosopis cineraria]
MMEKSENERSSGDREFYANGNHMNTAEVESSLDQGNVEAAESALKEGLSITSEEARTLIGKLEYQRGNFASALRVFDGVDLQAALQQLQSLVSDKSSAKKARPRAESPTLIRRHAASLMLESFYFKTKTLRKQGKITEATTECKSVLEGIEKTFSQGVSDIQLDNTLQEVVSGIVGLLPDLTKQAGSYQEALSAYRRALQLLSQWNFDTDGCARVQKGLAMLLLHGGFEASPPKATDQCEGFYVPKNNLEEAILLLMLAVRRLCIDKSKWDHSVMEHLTFALSVCGQTCVLAKQLEELVPGLYHRIDRWNLLALCLYGAGQNENALDLLRKSLHKHERPNDIESLLVAARICSENLHLAAEGVGYAQRAIGNAKGINEHLKGVSLRMLGLCLGKQAKVASSDFQRSNLQSKALKSLEGAMGFECNNSDLIFELGVKYAEHRNLTNSLRYAKQFFDETGGSMLEGWRLIALILSAQQRFTAAEVVINAALDETARWEQGPLLRLKAKLKISQSQPMDAIETYRYLLALIQAQKNSFGPMKINTQVQDDVKEIDVWHGLANLYASLSHWKDAEVCLQKARELKEYSAETVHIEGLLCEGRGQNQEAVSAITTGLLFGPCYVPSKIQMGVLLLKLDSKSKPLPLARSLLSDALRLEPTNRTAWFHLGKVHKYDGRIGDAADCFQAASMLEESDPVESFSTLL